MLDFSILLNKSHFILSNFCPVFVVSAPTVLFKFVVLTELYGEQCVPGSIPGLDVICGLSLLLVLFSAPRGFSPGTPVFPSPQKPTFPNSNSIRMQDLPENHFVVSGASWVNMIELIQSVSKFTQLDRSDHLNQTNPRMLLKEYSIGYAQDFFRYPGSGDAVLEQLLHACENGKQHPSDLA